LPDSIKRKYDKINAGIIDGLSELRGSWRKDAKDNLDEIIALRKEIQQLQKEKKVAESQLANNYPSFFDLIRPAAEPLSELQERLRAINGSFVHYFVGENTTIIMVIRPDGVHNKIINVGNTFLEMLVEQMSPLFSQSNSNFTVTDESGELPFRLDVASQLYQVIFEPIKDLIPPQSSIIISPDKALNRFPFESLVTNPEELTDDYDYAHAKFLIEEYKISYVPYGRMLDWPTFRKRSSKKTFLAFANPRLSVTGSEPSGNVQNNHDSDGRIGLNLKLEPSKFSEYEAAQIAKTIGRWSTKIYSESKATKARFLQESSKYQLLHLSLPGILDDSQPLYSKLYFSNQNDLDEVLETHELFNLRLNADLVVLSDMGREPKTLKIGESLNSLVHGFLYSGVPSIVTSLWNVHEKESSNLLVSFYSNLKLGLNKSEALQQAKVQYLKTGNRNPYYWASYLLFGNTDPINFQAQNFNYLLLITILAVILLTGIVGWKLFESKREGKSQPN
jgi:CHAT domain-containing protein